jgi:hypothetical protein
LATPPRSTSLTRAAVAHHDQGGAIGLGDLEELACRRAGRPVSDLPLGPDPRVAQAVNRRVDERLGFLLALDMQHRWESARSGQAHHGRRSLDLPYMHHQHSGAKLVRELLRCGHDRGPALRIAIDRRDDALKHLSVPP